MTNTKTTPRTPWLAVLSVYELRRLLSEVRATGKLPPRAEAALRVAPRRRALRTRAEPTTLQ